MIKRICIMTKSLKDHDYCVAGIDLQNGAWVRLVSSKDGGAFQKALLDDMDINVLDVVQVRLKGRVQFETQTENWLVDYDMPINKVGSKTLAQIITLRGIDKPKYIFENSKNELTNGEAKNLNHSLEMVFVNNVTFDTCVKGDGKNHHKICFDYNGENYKLALTDPKLRIDKLDSWQMPSATIIVSIPPIPYGDNQTYYKFVAKVFF